MDHRSSEINRVSQVTIVGGGTAGWLAAAMLNDALNARSEGGRVRVTLIESPNVPTVGVGEATVPGMPRLLGSLKLDEKEFFLRCNASFKLGVKFVHWDEDAAGNPVEYFHPFDEVASIRGVDPCYHFHRFVGPGHASTFFDRMLPSGEVIRAFRGPRRVEDGDFQFRVRHAYHLDAGQFALLLRDVAVSRGVEHVLDDVIEVQQGEDGFVTALKLKERGLVPVQLVVDCTGFRSRIIGQVLGEPFEPYSDYLLCDSALAVQLPHQDPTHLEPCTTSTGLGAGWSWRVPLYSRLGAGYVYSSQFRSDEEAIREFLDYLGPQAKDADPRVIRMRVGRMQRSWVKNCVSIGLAGGFVEPLESTAIYLIEMGVRWLIRHFPDRSMSPVLADSFNRAVKNLYEEVRDFIVMHYYTSNRTEPFWRAARTEIKVPDSLAESLELWRHTFPNIADTIDHQLFIYWNYLCVLYSKGYFEGCSYPLESAISKADWEVYCQRLEIKKKKLVANLPNHHYLLTSIRAAAEAQSGRRAPDAPRATVPLPDWGQEAAAETAARAAAS